jgi:hypothetical protein
MAKGQRLNMSFDFTNCCLWKPLETTSNNCTIQSVLTFQHLLWPHRAFLYEVLTNSTYQTYTSIQYRANSL